VLSMANAGPGTNGSQFFITVAPTPHLNDRHSVFGRVVEGQDVANAISAVPRNAQDRPNTEVSIKTVKIVRVGDKAKAFKADQATFDALRSGISQRAADREKAALQGLLDGIKEQHPGKEIVETASGLRYLVLAEGAGSPPNAGTTIKAHYTGKLTNGTVFDSSVQRGEPIAFPVGTGRVIKGWDEALSDMKKGEKRILIIPPALGYGARGIGPIPPNSTLIFEVELVDF